MAINSINSSGYSFGSLASIRRQAEAIVKRVEAESAARREEQKKTGLVRNPDTGDMVEISSISAETLERWEHREQINSISPGEAYIMFSASDPNAEEVERSKELGAKAAKIQSKMLAGKKLSGEEKSFLREHFPELAAKAAQAEMEAEQLRIKLQGCESKEDAHQVYMEAKMQVMSGTNKEDSSVLFLIAAIDEAFSQYMKQGNSSGKQIDILA